MMTSQEIESYSTIFLLLLATVGGLAVTFALMGMLADWLDRRFPPE